MGNTATDTMFGGAGMQQDIPCWVEAVNAIVSAEPYHTTAPAPVELLPWLFISDLRSIFDLDVKHRRGTLFEKKITHVLTTNRMYRAELQAFQNKLSEAGIQHHVVPGEDMPGYDMIGRHWDECRDFLGNVRDGGGRVVVHCIMGCNRSGLVSAAAIMVLEHKPVLEAVRILKEKRGIVLTNRSFQRQLCILAAKTELLGEKPSSIPAAPRRTAYSLQDNKEIADDDDNEEQQPADQQMRGIDP